MSDSRLSQVNADLTLLLADASYQAYEAFDKHPKVIPPRGWDYVDSWTGTDPYGFFFKTNEPYGLVFRSQTSPETFIFAFRGTDSIADGWEDIWANTAYFKPYKTPVGFPDIEVADGFNAVYVTADKSIPSMQQQLFTLLEKYQPKTLYITGHSLGSSLCELFTLDVAVSLPGELTAQTINFACPRVGKSGFQTYYDGLPSQQNPTTKTIRIVNYWDFVPALPPNFILGYDHVGDYFLLAFWKKGAWVPNVLVRHSLANYITILKLAFKQPNQVFIGEAPGIDGSTPVTLKSASPPSTMVSSPEELGAGFSK